MFEARFVLRWRAQRLQLAQAKHKRHEHVRYVYDPCPSHCMAFSEGEPSIDEINDNKVFNCVCDIGSLASVFRPHAREVYE